MYRPAPAVIAMKSPPAYRPAGSVVAMKAPPVYRPNPPAPQRKPEPAVTAPPVYHPAQPAIRPVHAVAAFAPAARIQPKVAAAGSKPGFPLAIPPVVQRKATASEPLVVVEGQRYKKKAKERKVQIKVTRTLDEQIRKWIEDYGHSFDRHSGLSTAALDGRNIPLATTYETDEDLFKGAKQVISANEGKLNAWYESEGTDRIALWAYRPEDCHVRGRRKLKRPAWHQHVNPMPPAPGFEDVDEDELPYVIGIFDRDSWNGSPKGLVTCFPADNKDVS